MSEFSRSGHQLPNEPKAEAEHQRDVREAVEQDQRAAAAAKAQGRRPWWRFWGRRPT